MPDKTAVERAILAAFEHHPEINLHRFPIRLEFDAARGAVILEGEVEHIIAKKRAFEIASRTPGVDGVMDRLCVAPAERRGDGAIRSALSDALLQEPALRPCGLEVWNKGAMETLRATDDRQHVIHASVEDGIVQLTGQVPSLSHRRLAGVLAWWTPGCRDVLNGLKVTPPEADNDGEIADALRLVLEKDPLLPHADQIGIHVHERVVTLDGAVGTREERRMAEIDAWYVMGVDQVVNHIVVRP